MVSYSVRDKPNGTGRDADFEMPGPVVEIEIGLELAQERCLVGAPRQHRLQDRQFNLLLLSILDGLVVVNFARASCHGKAVMSGLGKVEMSGTLVPP
ncbi:MAG: hypothetical protein ABI831_08460, partial [Betaproteobacteria bacterium]